MDSWIPAIAAVDSHYHLDVIDIIESPGLAEEAKILATPALEKVAPGPVTAVRSIQLQFDRLTKIILTFCNSTTLFAFELRLLCQGLIFSFIAKMKTLGDYVAQVMRV